MASEGSWLGADSESTDHRAESRNRQLGTSSTWHQPTSLASGQRHMWLLHHSRSALGTEDSGGGRTRLHRRLSGHGRSVPLDQGEAGSVRGTPGPGLLRSGPRRFGGWHHRLAQRGRPRSGSAARSSPPRRRPGRAAHQETEMAELPYPARTQISAGKTTYRNRSRTR